MTFAERVRDEAIARIRLGEEPDSRVRILRVVRGGDWLGPFLVPTPGLAPREAEGKPGEWRALGELAGLGEL